ncbi:MAG: NepR family anti-sigma factor [Pseudomonadota bacterium]
MSNKPKKDQARVIDENLRKVFDATLEEGIPDRFKALLDQLRQQETSQGRGE